MMSETFLDGCEVTFTKGVAISCDEVDGMMGAVTNFPLIFVIFPELALYVVA